MITNSLYNIQSTPLQITKNTYFSLEKQSSEVNYSRNQEHKINTLNNFQNNNMQTKGENYTTSFNGYYDMFVASQALHNSEVLNKFNYQMHIKKYA